MEKRAKFFTLLILAAISIAAGPSSASILFQDNFDSYAYTYPTTTLAAQTSPWQGEATQYISFAPWVPGKAQFMGYWEMPTKLAYVNVGQNDYTVQVDAWQDGSYIMDSYAAARVNGSTRILAGAIVSGGNVWANLSDSTGYHVGDFYVGTYVNTQPITISLTVQGSSVNATISNAGNSLHLNYTTSILTGGNTGFGGEYPWNYPVGDFDNFVVTSVPEPATMIIMAIGGLTLFRKK